MFSRLVTLLFASLVVFGTAEAQNRSSLDSPTCMMWSEAPIYGRLLDDYSHPLFIWYWYAYGFSEVREFPNWVNQQDRFAECFEGKSKGKCGFKPNGSIRKALAKNRTDGFDKKPLKNLFQESPPPEAIAYAMKSLGTCFGDAPALPTLDQLGLVSGEFDMGACMQLATRITYDSENLSRELAAHDGWGIALFEYMTKPGVSSPGKACRVVPKAGLPSIDAILESRKQEQVAYDNRTIAQRVAGLDAFDITYSLVYRTISHDHAATRPLPEGAYEWAVDYGAKVADGYPEPAIPDAVQQWAVEQPLDSFEAVEDPFASRKRVHPSEITQSVWARRVRSQLDKAAPNEERIAVQEGCSILWGYAWGDVQFGKRSPQTTGEAEYYRLLTQTPDKWSQTMCNETPVGIFYAAKARYEKEQYEASLPPKPSEWDEINRRLSEYANKPRENKAPYKPPTTRCYVTGQTESGLGREVCFTN
ncbi:hypothetical protein [Hyphomonas sp.]|uniref:hypothetical protein n=1 Tax=Hyphomonas sp. TaxID=87 RepID=UPI0030FCB558